MVMNAIKKIAQFTTGVAIGALAGATVGHFTAPSSGGELRATGRDLIASAKIEGEQARIIRETELRQKFRGQVGDQQAFSDQVAQIPFSKESSTTSQPTTV